MTKIIQFYIINNFIIIIFMNQISKTQPKNLKTGRYRRKVNLTSTESVVHFLKLIQKSTILNIKKPAENQIIKKQSSVRKEQNSIQNYYSNFNISKKIKHKSTFKYKEGYTNKIFMCRERQRIDVHNNSSQITLPLLNKSKKDLNLYNFNQYQLLCKATQFFKKAPTEKLETLNVKKNINDRTQFQEISQIKENRFREKRYKKFNTQPEKYQYALRENSSITKQLDGSLSNINLLQNRQKMCKQTYDNNFNTGWENKKTSNQWGFNITDLMQKN